MALQLSTLSPLANTPKLLATATSATFTAFSLTSSQSSWMEKFFSTVSLVGASLFALPSALHKTYTLGTGAICFFRVMPASFNPFSKENLPSSLVEAASYLPHSRSLEKISTDTGSGIFQGFTSFIAALFSTKAAIESFPENQKSLCKSGLATFSIFSFLGFNELFNTYYLDQERALQYFVAQLTSALSLYSYVSFLWNNRRAQIQ